MVTSSRKILEKHVERKVVDYCKKHGLYCRKFVSPSNRSVPDRVIVGPRGVLFLELKRPGEEPTTLQWHEIREIREKGGNAEWADTHIIAIAFVDYICLGKVKNLLALTNDDLQRNVPNIVCPSKHGLLPPQPNDAASFV